MLQISVVVLAASQTRPPSNPVRGGGGVIGVVMGTAGTTERERLLVMWSRHAYDGVLSSPRVMDGPDQQQCVASRRVASSYLYSCFALTYKHNLKPRGC